MLDSRVLETAIGLIFLFLGFSLATTAIQEFFASAFKLRASTLQAGLKTMLAGADGGLDFYRKVIGHPLIAAAGKSPSYVSASQFSSAAVQIISGTEIIPSSVESLQAAIRALPNSQFKTVVNSLFREGETVTTNFEGRLQTWFDQSMDRVSGVYKRLSQYIRLGIGVAVAFVFQANAIAIGSNLWNEPALRASLNDIGALTVKSSAAPPPREFASHLATFHFAPLWEAWPTITLTWFIGCAITAIAVSLGAPFWFDLLQTFVSVRGTGPVPQKSPGI